jgi:hypothetical protein
MAIANESQRAQTKPSDASLRSVRELIDYSVHSIENEVGKLDDLILDDRFWEIRYLAIDLRKWLPGGKKTLISPAYVKNITWDDEKIELSLKSDAIKKAPEYHPDKTITEDFELTVFKYFGSQKIN